MTRRTTRPEKTVSPERHHEAPWVMDFAQFLVRVIYDCGACHEIESKALAQVVGWKVTVKELAMRMRFSRCGKKPAKHPNLFWVVSLRPVVIDDTPEQGPSVPDNYFTQRRGL